MGGSPFRTFVEAEEAWSAVEADGHDMAGLVNLLSKVPNGSGKPMVIVAHTVKGKGVSFMEDDNNWHYRIPKAAEVARLASDCGDLPQRTL